MCENRFHCTSHGVIKTVQSKLNNKTQARSQGGMMVKVAGPLQKSQWPQTVHK